MFTHRAANDEHSFLLTSHPLYYLVGTLGESVAAGVWASDAVKLEERRYPC